MCPFESRSRPLGGVAVSGTPRTISNEPQTNRTYAASDFVVASFQSYSVQTFVAVGQRRGGRRIATPWGRRHMAPQCESWKRGGRPGREAASSQ